MRRLIPSLFKVMNHGVLISGLTFGLAALLDQSAALVIASVILATETQLVSVICRSLPGIALLAVVALLCFRRCVTRTPVGQRSATGGKALDVEATGPVGAATPEPDESGTPRLFSDGDIKTVLDLGTGREIRREIPVDGPPLSLEVSQSSDSERVEEDQAEAPLFDTMFALLQEAGFKTLYLPMAPTVWACQWGEVGTYSLQFVAQEDCSAIISRTRVPIRIPSRLRWRAMEFATRANEQLVVGAFELGLKDGEMWFRNSCMLGDDGIPTASMLGNLAGLGIEVCDRYVPLLLDALYGRRAIAESVAAAISA